jgi:hypothetical protein
LTRAAAAVDVGVADASDSVAPVGPRAFRAIADNADPSDRADGDATESDDIPAASAISK